MPNAIRLGRPGSATSLSRTTNLPTITSFTLMGWFRLTSGNAGQFSTFFAHGGSASSSYYFVGEVQPGLHFGTVVNGTAVTGSAITADRWYHVALTVNGTSGSNVLAYLNGVVDVTTTAATVTAQKLWIGNQADGDWLNGNAAAIKLWNRVLTIDEIIAEMPYAVPMDWSGLNAAYPLGNGWELASCGLVIPKGTSARWPDISAQIGNEWTEAGAIDTENGPPIQFAPERNFRPRYFVPAAGGGVSLTPGVGAVTAIGFAPAIALPVNVAAGVGAATLTGFVPAVSIGVRVNPGVGAPALAGFAPTIAVSNNQNVAAGSGAATFSGFAPAAVVNTRVLPGVGGATLSGFSPSIATPVNVLAGVGAATFAGFAPSVQAGAGALPGTGVVTVTGFAPTVSASANQNVTPGQGAALLTGFAPTVFASDRRDVFPGVGQLTAVGLAPTVFASNPQNVHAGVGAIIATSFAPTVTVQPQVVVQLVDEPLYSDFDDLSTWSEFDDLCTWSDFDDLRTWSAFTTPSGVEMLTLEIYEGETMPIPFTLRGANGAQDTTGATSMKWFVGRPGALIITNVDLQVVGAPANGKVSYTPAAAEVAPGKAGKYDTLAVVTLPGAPSPIVRKFPGKLMIKKALA
jgi:hypothetical protein